MDTMKAFMLGEAARATNKPAMVFDWNKAARLILEHQPKKASAGLHSDWEWTGGDIWNDGKPNTDDYTYLSSIWAVPEISLDDGDAIECWILESDSPGWDCDTKWPQSALDIINGKE